MTPEPLTTEKHNTNAGMPQSGIRTRLTAEELAFVATCEVSVQRLTDQQVSLYIKQARQIGEL
jgi:hypothetical protein